MSNSAIKEQTNNNKVNSDLLDKNRPILVGDVIEKLKEIPDESIDCVITSPPYWGLRDYGAEGQIGLEKTPEDYVKKMVEVFREVKRVLKKEGTCWLNLGDSYASQGGGQVEQTVRGKENYVNSGQMGNEGCGTSRKAPQGLKPKDLVGIPWRVAFALQADGWYLRQDIIWSKPNPMPESVRDRCTKSHEYIFLLTKSPKYYYDAEAIKEKVGEVTRRAGTFRNDRYVGNETFDNSCSFEGKRTANDGKPSLGGRNKRSVWTITTKPFKEAHFATFPEDLVEPMIKAGTSEKGVCPDCGKPWVRIVENLRESNMDTDEPLSPGGHQDSKTLHRDGGGVYSRIKTIGWQPSCKCGKEPVPATVLDPFMGSGTTLLVARKLLREGIGIELNPDYAEMAKRRITIIPRRLDKFV